ncbi:MAG: 2-hydroxyacid dehydrogenase [Gammaproteobacteria bacterium]
MRQGVFLDAASLDTGLESQGQQTELDFSRLRGSLEAWQVYARTTVAEVEARLADAEVVVTNKVRLTAAQLAGAKKLKLICIAATGTNNVDLTAARQQGLGVCNVRAYATPSVVQHVFALILNLLRHIPDYQRAVRQGRWQQSAQFCLLDYPIAELQEKVLGIVGYGELGQAVARAAECFGMAVRVAQRPGRAAGVAGRTPLHELLPQIDILTLHCPLAENTRHLIGAPELRLMKPDAMLINTARGGLVDEAALAAALRRGQLGGAGIDVLAEEPPRDSPLLATDLPNLLLTPHIAWASRAARQRLLDQVADNILAFYAGKVQNRVDR